jgi:outer membrane protein TolC
MRYRNATLAVTAALLLTPAPQSAGTITREAFLERIRDVHPLFEKEALTARIDAEERASLAGAEDWRVFSSLTYAHEEPAIAIAGPEETDAVAFDVGIERQIWRTGGRLSASYSTFRTSLSIDPLFGVPDLFYQNELAVSYTHPLLRNRGGLLDRLAWELKAYDVDFSDVVSRESRENFLAETSRMFLDWVFLTEQRRIVLERLALSEAELDRTRRKRAAHLVEEADVIRAEDAVRFWKQEETRIESRRKSLQAELAVLSKDEEILGLEPDFPLYDRYALPPLSVAIERLKAHSRLVRAVDIRLDQLRHSRKGFADTEKPDLSLVARFNVKNADGGFGGSLEMDKPDAVVGLQLSVPLGNRTAKSKIAMTDLQIARLEKEREELVLRLVAALTDIHIEIGELEKVLALNREQIESARRRTEEELKLYEQGRGELTFVIQSRDNEQNAALLYASNALTYQKLLVAWQALMDELFE